MKLKSKNFPDAEVMLKNAYHVWFDRSGNSVRCDVCDRTWEYKNLGEIRPIHNRWYSLSVCVCADTPEAAIKIAAEKRAKYLAEKNGL